MSGERDLTAMPERPLLTRIATAFSFLLALVCIVGGIYCHFRFPVHFESETGLWLDPFVPDISNTNNVVAVLEPRSVRPYRNTLAQVMDSAPIARAAARELLATGDASLPESLSRNENELTQAISGITSVRTSHDDAVLTVVGLHDDRKLPPIFANAVADAFIEFNMHNRLAPYSNTVAAIAREVERLAFAQVDHVTALERFQEKNRAEGVESRRASLVARLTKARSDLAQASQNRQIAEVDWASMATVSVDGLYQVELIANDPRAVVAREALVKQVALVRVLEQRYREKHPRLKTAIAAQETMRADMVAACREVREGVAERLKTARAREKLIREDVGDAENASRTLGVIIREEATLESRANAAIVNLDRMRERLYDARLALSLVVNDVQIIERATSVRFRRDPLAGRLFLLAFALIALALVLRSVSRPRQRVAPFIPMREEEDPSESPAATDVEDDAPPVFDLPVAADEPTAAPVLAQDADVVSEPEKIVPEKPVENREGVPPQLVSSLPETAKDERVQDEQDGPAAEDDAPLEAQSDTKPEPEDVPVVPEPDLPAQDSEPDPHDGGDALDVTESDTTVADAPEDTVPEEDASVEDAPAVDDSAVRDDVPEEDDTASDAFWAQLKHPTLDELESGAVNAGENVGEGWMTLLSHVAAAQDRDRLVRLARHLRMTRPFGDRVRRLAEGHLARIRDDLEGAAQIYAAGLTSSPEALDLLGGLTRCQLFMGDRDGLETSLDAAVSKEPQADVAYVRAMLAMEEGDHATARSELRVCITHVPDVEAMICLAWIAIEEERFRLAEKSVRYALNISPNHVGALDVLGVILYRQGSTGEAMRVFEKALVHGPEAWGTMIHLVELYNETGESRKATGLIRRLRANRERLDDEWVGVLEQLESGSSRVDD